MDINAFTKDWLNASNTYNTKKYLEKWQENAVLDDQSVGQVFKGYSGIKKYFESYFIGYRTQTRLVKLHIISKNNVHIEVEFTGKCPAGRIRGVFDFAFKNDKIEKAKAALA